MRRLLVEVKQDDVALTLASLAISLRAIVALNHHVKARDRPRSGGCGVAGLRIRRGVFCEPMTLR
jgi:hypothetical protein